METLRYVLLANGLLMVVSVAFYLLLRHETFFNTNRLMLWLGVLSVLVLPALQFPDWRPQRVRSVMQHTARVIAPSVLPRVSVAPPVTITFPNGRSYPVTPVRRLARFGWSWQLALIGLYLVGVGGLFVRFLLQLVSIRQLIYRSTQQPYDTFTLVANPVIDAPFSFFRWVVLNPARHTGDELEQILRHERVHVRQRHSMDMLMAEGVCIIFWMNPAAYLFRKLVHQTLEFCADQAVLAEGIDARSYQYNLLKVSLASATTPIVNSFSTSQLRDRIRMMNRQRSSWFQMLKYPVVMVLSLAVVTAFAHHKAEQIATQVAEPAVRSLKNLLPKDHTKTSIVPPAKPASYTVPIQAKTIHSTLNRPTPLATLSIPLTDSVLATPYSERRSDSRLVTYKDDILYWVITPKASLEDISGLQRELAKHGIKLQLRQIKYDPSYSFIDQIDIAIVDGSLATNIEDTDSDNGKPLKPMGGYCPIGIWREPRRPHSPDKPIRIPENLQLIAKNDEIVISDVVNGGGKESAILDSRSKFQLLGTTSTRFDRAYFDNKSTRNSGILIKPDKSLTLDEDSKTAKIFINNQSVDGNAVEMLSVDKLYAVIKKTQYDSVNKRVVTVGLLLYMIDK